MPKRRRPNKKAAPRCPESGKKRYPSLLDAQIAQSRLEGADRAGRPGIVHAAAVPYRCACGGWHLGNKRGR